MFMLDVLPEVAIIFTAFGGFLLALYIRYKKTHQQVMVCPLHSNCEAVTHSEFASFFGIPVELLGVAYYAIVAVSYGAFTVAPSLATPLAIFMVLVLSTAAFLFTLYLTFIQAFTLKQWCTWCLTSGALSTTIFLIALFGTEHSHSVLLQENRALILIGHMAGLILGLGGATIGDIFFFKFLKDLRISRAEADVLRTISQVIWFGLAILVLTGIGLFLPQVSVLLATPKFLVKMIVVAVIITNGAFLNLYISPKLLNMSFGKRHQHHPGELRHDRKLAFALGGVSFSSWYTAFILGLLSSVPLSFGQLLLAYVMFVLLAVSGSQMMERILGRRPMPAIPVSPELIR